MNVPPLFLPIASRGRTVYRPGMSTSYHKGNVRADMVREGLRILAEEGLEAVTLRRLAREIGIAPSSIYNHFANRRPSWLR